MMSSPEDYSTFRCACVRWAAGALTLILLFVSCTTNDVMEEPPIACEGTSFTFDDVSPIIETSCAKDSGCHGFGSVHGPGALTNYQQVFNARGDIKSSVENGTMPEDGRLSTETKRAIICWIEAGAPELP